MVHDSNKTNYEKQQKGAYVKNITTLDNNPQIKGYDFEKDFDFSKFTDSFLNTGFQATELGKAIEVVKQMRKDNATIIFSFTGNAISSGLREIITFLVKNKFIDVIITTSSGIEEDVIKSLKDFKLGDFEVKGRQLFEYGVGRIGNILVPFDRYLYFEKFMNPFFDKVYAQQKKQKRPLSPVEITKMLGIELSEGSFLYWATKNNIPVHCPAIMDGSFGDLAYFMKQRTPEFMIDATLDYKQLVQFVMNQEKTGALILGGGVAKHYNLNSNIFREGHDYAVYLTTAQEFDGSDSGGNEEEAKSWAKIKLNAPTAKVKSDFTITFPILVAATFAQEFYNESKVKSKKK